MLSETNPPHVIGCDVGKDTIVVFDSRTRRTVTIDNEPGALARTVGGWPRNALVVCEATGGYEAALLDAVSAAGLAAHRADARKVKAFIRSLGRLAKTDGIDAAALARYGAERGDRLALWQPADEDQQELAALVRLRDDLVRTRADLTRRLKAPGGQVVKATLADLIGDVARRIEQLEGAIAELLARADELAARVAVIDRIPGCGQVTAITLAALMPELGSCNRKQAGSLAGLAPHPRQSGARDGYRPVRGGRPELKRCLFMAAMAARRCNPELRAFHERLVAAGKKPLVAITAVMRKLITIINARLRDAALAPAPSPA